jgi:OST-HTH/LOTUS domain-containing protein
LVEESKATQQKRTQATRAKKTTKEGAEPEKEELDPIPVLSQAFEMAVGQDGWARLDVMGNAIYQVDPGFDPRTYGHKQLSRMLNKLKDRFEMRTQDIEGQLIFYVRMKE